MYRCRQRRLCLSLLLLDFDSVIATQLNSTRRRVELSCVAINRPLNNDVNVEKNIDTTGFKQARIKSQWRSSASINRSAWTPTQ